MAAKAELRQTLQVGDLTIAGPDQIPYLDIGGSYDAIPCLGEIVNFLRSGCPAVQVGLRTEYSLHPGKINEGREKLIRSLRLLAGGKEIFEFQRSIVKKGLNLQPTRSQEWGFSKTAGLQINPAVFLFRDCFVADSII